MSDDDIIRVVNGLVEEATKGKYESLNQLAKAVSSRGSKTCDGCGYPVNDDWQITLNDSESIRRNPELPECTGKCPRCQRIKQLEV